MQQVIWRPAVLIRCNLTSRTASLLPQRYLCVSAFSTRALNEHSFVVLLALNPLALQQFLKMIPNCYILRGHGV